MNWYFQASADFFGGFFQAEDPHRQAQSAPDVHGPYATFSEANADALAFYRDVAKAAHQAAVEIKATPKPKRSYPKPRDPLELEAEHDQHPERSPAR